MTSSVGFALARTPSLYRGDHDIANAMVARYGNVTGSAVIQWRSTAPHPLFAERERTAGREAADHLCPDPPDAAHPIFPYQTQLPVGAGEAEAAGAAGEKVGKLRFGGAAGEAYHP